MMKFIVTLTVLALQVLFHNEVEGQSLDSVQRDIKVNVNLKRGLRFIGAYHSHTKDHILILHPFSKVQKTLQSGPTSSTLFAKYMYTDIDRLQLRKKSTLAGFGNGLLIGGVGGALVGVAAGSSPDSFFGPGASAVLGGIIFGSLGGLMGASSKFGFERFYQFNAKNNSWSTTDYETLNAKIGGQLNKKKRRLVLLAGLGYSSEVIHLGARYYLDDFNDLSITGSFILAASKGVGIDYRRSFGQAQLSDRGAWFWLVGFSYKKSETRNRFGDGSTYYLSGSFGRNFYFTKNSGLSIDIGYDYATKEVLFKDKLKSYFGPRFQFFF